MSLSVIIPSCTPSNAQACVAAIRRAGETCRIILVDDFPEPTDILFADQCTIVPGVKPFCFARNINLGIAEAGDDDVILLNDDAQLKTLLGFYQLRCAARDPKGLTFGIVSPAITANVGNLEQLPADKAPMFGHIRKATHHTLVFVCVYIRREVLDELATVGVIDEGEDPKHPGWRKNSPGRIMWLDERYSDYGYDDDDLCERVRQLGYDLGIYDGCLVDHGTLPSTYRNTRRVCDLAPNRQRFFDKWGFLPGAEGRA